MRVLKPTEIKSIEQFFRLSQSSLLRIMEKYLNTKYDKVFVKKEYIIAVGDLPVALVAHLDTVFSNPPHNIFYDRVKNVMWSPEGLGADDRAGIYAIVEIIKQGLRPTIIFTTDEERGGLGATKLIKDFPKPITNLKYIIELDRRGANDCVFYDCDNIEFEKYIESFDFITAFGTFSDISIICPKWEIAGVNLSIGYVDEHSYCETLYIGNMLSTISKVIKMLQVIHKAEYFKYIPFVYNNTNVTDDFGWDPSYGVSKETWLSWVKQALIKCDCCDNEDFDYNLFSVLTKEGKMISLCSDCISNRKDIEWCVNCGTPFICTDNEKSNICYKCKAKGEINNG